MSYNRLEITSDKNQGSFVRNLQGVTGTGFQQGTHVHKDWWAKTKTYEQVMQDAHVAVENREDIDRKSTRLNSSHVSESRMPSSA